MNVSQQGKKGKWTPHVIHHRYTDTLLFVNVIVFLNIPKVLSLYTCFIYKLYFFTISLVLLKLRSQTIHDGVLMDSV